MLIASGIVLLLALFFTFAYVTQLAVLIVSVMKAGEGKLAMGQMLIPSILWAVFFVLRYWPLN
jgi:hypothetical protein